MVDSSIESDAVIYWNPVWTKYERWSIAEWWLASIQKVYLYDEV